MTDLYLIYRQNVNVVSTGKAEIMDFREREFESLSLRHNSLVLSRNIPEIKGNATASGTVLNRSKRVDWGWSDLPMIYEDQKELR